MWSTLDKTRVAPHQQELESGEEKSSDKPIVLVRVPWKSAKYRSHFRFLSEQRNKKRRCVEKGKTA